MIKHHPNSQLLNAYAKGELSASLSIGVAIHIEMCDECKAKVAKLTEQLASSSFEHKEDVEVITFDEQPLDMQAMINMITENDDIEELQVYKPRTVSFNQQQYMLPRALNKVEVSKASHFGKIARSRVKVHEDTIHANLLHINAGGSVPEHTHKGYELTVLISGSFADDNGEYHQGDFILLDKQHTHSPVSEKGCLCYTVADDKLHFTQGINKLLNPIGNFIY